MSGRRVAMDWVVITLDVALACVFCGAPQWVSLGLTAVGVALWGVERRRTRRNLRMLRASVRKLRLGRPR